ncbi:acyltransferase [Paracoccus sediminis]|uniref:Acyltransferase n=1 Tax=Paracoccus sediminis TaxID=1214787 RepID=A0A238XTD5_9RHOB|nr:acyltransferase [Paracoccus sediminis]SNR61828.1 Peptidoglycan/LPS O-acetylase OafA/YrhL, contains acyltransferase and SGNH-hydrolase domains [Paracoccus sediminis]
MGGFSRHSSMDVPDVRGTRVPRVPCRSLQGRADRWGEDAARAGTHGTTHSADRKAGRRGPGRPLPIRQGRNIAGLQPFGMTVAFQKTKEPFLSSTANIRHIEALTAMRGLAAILVVIFHYSGGFLPNFTPSQYTAFLSKGYLWVDFFFLLSGYVMAHAYAADFRDRASAGTVRKFIFARFSRIYPLHLAILLAFLLLELVKLLLISFGIGQASFPVFEGARSVESLASNVLLLQTTGLHGGLTWNGPAWSIGAEWFAYLAFPILVVGIMKRGMVASSLMIALSLLGLALLSGMGDNLDVTYDYGILRCLFGFVIGMVLHRFSGLATRFRLGSDAAAIALLALTGVLMHAGVRDIAIPPVFALLILSLSLNNGRVSRGLSHPALVWLGTISYSVYLSHMLILSVINVVSVTMLGKPVGRFLETGPSLLLLAGLVGLVIALSGWLYVNVEARARSALQKSRFARRHVYR